MDVPEPPQVATQRKKDHAVLQIEKVSVSQEIDHEAERAVRTKTDLRLVPVLCLLLMVAFLDRTNIGNARIQGMDKDLNLQGSDYNIALFIFFIPYILLDIPSNMLMKRLRPSMYLSGLMFCWGMLKYLWFLLHSFSIC